MPIEDCFVDCSMFTDGQILQMDDRRLLCLGDEFLGRAKVCSVGEGGLGNRQRR